MPDGNPAPGFIRNPAHRIAYASAPVRTVIRFAGAVIADSRRPVLAEETGHRPVFYLPQADVRLDLLSRTDRSTHCPYKGTASYWDIRAGGRVAGNAVWCYEAPYDEAAPIAGLMAFYADRVDAIEVIETAATG